MRQLSYPNELNLLFATIRISGIVVRVSHLLSFYCAKGRCALRRGGMANARRVAVYFGRRDNNAALAIAGCVNLLPIGDPDTQKFVSGCRSTIDGLFLTTGARGT